MKKLFLTLFYLFTGSIVCAAEEFNEQELAGLAQIKATVEGRVRYNQTLLKILNEPGVQEDTRLQNYCSEVGVNIHSGYNCLSHQGMIEDDLSFLHTTHQILLECLNSENKSKYLTALKLNINTSLKNFNADYTSCSAPVDNDEFHERYYYDKMKLHAQSFRVNPTYEDMEGMFSFRGGAAPTASEIKHSCQPVRKKSVQRFREQREKNSDPARFTKMQPVFSPVAPTDFNMIEIGKKLLDISSRLKHTSNTKGRVSNDHCNAVNECCDLIERWNKALSLVAQRPAVKISNYESQKFFFDVASTIAEINLRSRELNPILDQCIENLRANVERELDDSPFKNPPKKKKKKKNKEKKSKAREQESELARELDQPIMSVPSDVTSTDSFNASGDGLVLKSALAKVATTKKSELAIELDQPIMSFPSDVTSTDSSNASGDGLVLKSALAEVATTKEPELVTRTNPIMSAPSDVTSTDSSNASGDVLFVTSELAEVATTKEPELAIELDQSIMSVPSGVTATHSSNASGASSEKEPERGMPSYSSLATAASPLEEQILTLRTEIPLIPMKFKDALDFLKCSFGATIEHRAVVAISLTGPSGLTKIFCHNSHGAQNKKRFPAWRINIKEGLVAAGYEARYK